MSQIYDMGPTALLSSEERRNEDFFALKIRRFRSGLNPRTWVIKASTLLLDHRSRNIKKKLHSLLPYFSSWRTPYLYQKYIRNATPAFSCAVALRTCFRVRVYPFEEFQNIWVSTQQTCKHPRPVFKHAFPNKTHGRELVPASRP